MVSGGWCCQVKVWVLPCAAEEGADTENKIKTVLWIEGNFFVPRHSLLCLCDTPKKNVFRPHGGLCKWFVSRVARYVPGSVHRFGVWPTYLLPFSPSLARCCSLFPGSSMCLSVLIMQQQASQYSAFPDVDHSSNRWGYLHIPPAFVVGMVSAAKFYGVIHASGIPLLCLWFEVFFDFVLFFMGFSMNFNGIQPSFLGSHNSRCAFPNLGQMIFFCFGSCSHWYMAPVAAWNLFCLWFSSTWDESTFFLQHCSINVLAFLPRLARLRSLFQVAVQPATSKQATHSQASKVHRAPRYSAPLALKWW